MSINELVDLIKQGEIETKGNTKGKMYKKVAK